LDEPAIAIASYPYANRIRDAIKARSWDLVVMDEAHKLRNAYRPSNKIGQGVRWATENTRKLLLTATPLQNSLLELFGLGSLIDEFLFGDIHAFREQYVAAGSDLQALRTRLRGFCKRTLRNQVTEYVRYTERHAITRPFRPSDDEHALYEAVSDFLRRETTYAIPHRQRHLTELILRKLLASSPPAIAGTLDTMRQRLETLQKEKVVSDPDFTETIVEAEELEEELLEEMDEDEADAPPEAAPAIDRKVLAEEIQELGRLATWARDISSDTKSHALLNALQIGFTRMAENGAAKKALIFTESRRTQDHLRSILERNGYAGQIVLFNGTNSGPETTAQYERWLARQEDRSRLSGSRDIDIRTALLETFRDDAAIMIATEAGAEGLNLQFCSLVVNYDLPWNPQRIEQRIGRCHRYGQQHDVVVINFLNERNAADRRVMQLLESKFQLFSGVFGASDEILGSIESGVDFEKRVLAIYQECRSPEEIDAAFQKLQDELDEQIRSRLNDTRRLLFEHFDEDVHQRLRLRMQDTQASLDRVGRQFWTLTRHQLAERARFNDSALVFDLTRPPQPDIAPGRYHLISKNRPRGEQAPADIASFLYRLSHPLGEYVLNTAKELLTPTAEIHFDTCALPARILSVEALIGRRGCLVLELLTIESADHEDFLLFSAFDDAGQSLDQETCEKLFSCPGREIQRDLALPAAALSRLAAEAKRHAEATISRSAERNQTHFHEARERLDRWADDMVLAAERELRDTKEQIKALRREARLAPTLDEQQAIQEKMRQLETHQRRQRQEIFKVEDEIEAKRDQLIGDLEKRVAQRTAIRHLFTILWSVV
jgi:superfamily II DNA/RNA helicase